MQNQFPLHVLIMHFLRLHLFTFAKMIHLSAGGLCIYPDQLSGGTLYLGQFLLSCNLEY